MSPSQPPPPSSHGSPASSSAPSSSGSDTPPGAPREAGHTAAITSTNSPPPPSSSSKPHHLTVGVFSKRKGVRYRRDGQVLSCRFCEILRLRDEPFLYEDEQVVVFRPLRPIVASHILIVPRAHIRNVAMLAGNHEALLRQMKRVAERVLLNLPSSLSSSSTVHGDDASIGPRATAVATGSSSLSNPDESDPLETTATGGDHPGDSKHSEESSKGTDDEDSCSPNNTIHKKSTSLSSTTSRRKNQPPALKFKFAFHVPPFNSIDHVHMHAFRDEPRRMGVFGRIKYRTESWWCRSFDDVLARVSGGDFAKEAAPHDDEDEPLDNNNDHPPPPSSSLRATSSMKRHAADLTNHQRC